MYVLVEQSFKAGLTVIHSRTQTVVDISNRPLPSQIAAEGSRLYLTVHLPPSMEHRKRPNTTRLLVTHLDAANHRVAWESRLPLGLLHSERWQWLTVLGNGKIRYETIEVFNGPFAWLVRWFVGASLRQGFQVMADGLKTRSESLIQS